MDVDAILGISVGGSVVVVISDGAVVGIVESGDDEVYNVGRRVSRIELFAESATEGNDVGERTWCGAIDGSGASAVGNSDGIKLGEFDKMSWEGAAEGGKAGRIVGIVVATMDGVDELENGSSDGYIDCAREGEKLG